MLREAGHTVIEAGSGGAALERLDQREPRIDLLIADLAMPGMSGFELARAARQERPDLPILFITGFADIARPEDGANEIVLQKPFRADELNGQGRRGAGLRWTAGVSPAHFSLRKRARRLRSG